jgi:hypothetical protein
MPFLSNLIRPFLHRAKFGLLSSMGISRRANRVEPLQPPAEASMYEGLWIAVLDDKVIAAASTSTDLAYELFKLGPAASDAVMQRVQKPSDRVLVGMG